MGQELASGRSIPLWRKIADSLRSEIANGVFAPGARLPTEAELVVRFDVNRHTVRRALIDLQGCSLIRVEQGRGSFVTEDVLQYPIAPRTSFAENLRWQNRQPRSRFVRFEEMPAGDEVADSLGVRRGQPVIFAERLNWADDQPVAIGQHWFCANRFPSIASLLDEERSVSKALERLGVEDYTRRNTCITTRLPTIRESKHLAQPRGMPVQVTRAVNYDPEGKAIEISIGIFSGSRVRIVTSP